MPTSHKSRICFHLVQVIELNQEKKLLSRNSKKRKLDEIKQPDEHKQPKKQEHEKVEDSKPQPKQKQSEIQENIVGHV